MEVFILKTKATILPPLSSGGR